MFLTTKGRYAVLAMLDLAINQQGVQKIAEISSRNSIAVNYLEQLFFKLKKANLIIAIRGPTGGYKLAKRVSEINIMDIICAVGENFKLTKCSGKRNCAKDGGKCRTHDLWESIERSMSRQLNNITLHTLLHESQDLSQDFNIMRL